MSFEVAVVEDNQTTFQQYGELESAVSMSDESFYEKVIQYCNGNPIEQISLLRGMKKPELSHFLKKATIVRVRKGKRIIEQGKQDKTINILLSGMAEVTVNESPEKAINVLRAGNTFVENDIFGTGLSKANLTALFPSVILIVPIEFDDNFLHQQYTIASKIILNWLQEISAFNQIKEQTEATSSYSNYYLEQSVAA